MYNSQQIDEYRAFIDSEMSCFCLGEGSKFLSTWKTLPIKALEEGKRLGLPLYKTLDIFTLKFQYFYPAKIIQGLVETVYSIDVDDPHQVLLLYYNNPLTDLLTLELEATTSRIEVTQK